MKAKELMVGDWVKHINGTPYQVTCIKDNDFACGIPHLWSYNNKFEPIPITVGILEKNGFIFDGTQHWLIKSDKLMISVCPVQPDNEWWDKFSTGIEVSSVIADVTIDGVKQIYVHQLQNSLRLCGIDKEIVL